jgi:pyruvate/2-oxoglutarate dehydrogenase complex dihydrolipoamide dehydrogenase (E3) component
VTVGEPEVDFAAVMQRMRRRRAGIAHHDSARRFAGLGVDVFFGDATFASADTVRVDGATLRFSRAVIATGGRATAPPIPGLADVPYLSNETLFWLTERPARLIVLGGGPIGCEMAQAFARLGSRVTVLEVMPHVLPREDADAAALVQRQLMLDGVTLELGVKIREVRQRGADVVATIERPGPGDAETIHVTADRILVAAGRAPNIEDLDLDAAGIAFTPQGVTVDDRLRTTNRRVYAAGDVCSAFKFTHAADAMARIVLQNALFYGRKKASALVIPWCTYTEPEVAHVGLYEQEARQRERKVETITIDLADVDRAVVDEETDGFVRVHHERGRLLGCTIVAPQAGDLIGEAAYALTHGGTLNMLSATVHPYPTRAEALRKAGNAWRRTLLTPRLKRWFERYFRWTG